MRFNLNVCFLMFVLQIPCVLGFYYFVSGCVISLLKLIIS